VIPRFRLHHTGRGQHGNLCYLPTDDIASAPYPGIATTTIERPHHESVNFVIPDDCNNRESLMNRKASLMMLTLVIAFVASGCDVGKPQLLGPKNFDGGIFGDVDAKAACDWIQIANNSDHDLDDVNVRVTFLCEGVDQKPLHVDEHWDHWKKGDIKKVMARNSEGQILKNLLRADGAGTSRSDSFVFVVGLHQQF
jgi:hypothetical protein